jgi:hypothetical protein
MKTTKEIAQIVLERRARMNPTVMQGEMLNVLGQDGLSEAINRRWLIPNYESGYLQVSNHETAVNEMQEIAALPEPTAQPDQLGESRNIAMQHAIRARADILEASVLSEISAPATGRPAPGFASAPPAAAPTSSAPPAATGGSYGIGDDVAVVENGKTFQGKVQMNHGGRFKVSFGGGERPADRDYAPDELRRVAPGQPGQPAQPGAPAAPIR